jgi:hypothetical protein
VRSSLRYAAVLAAMLPLSSLAQQAEERTVAFVHIVKGFTRSLEILESSGAVRGISDLKQTAFSFEGHPIGKDKITADYKSLLIFYDRAWNNPNSCKILEEGRSTTPESVLNVNVVVTGPRKNEITQIARKRLDEIKKEWQRPDIEPVYTTCPPLTPVTDASRASPELNKGSKEKQPASHSLN